MAVQKKHPQFSHYVTDYLISFLDALRRRGYLNFQVEDLGEARKQQIAQLLRQRLAHPLMSIAPVPLVRGFGRVARVQMTMGSHPVEPALGRVKLMSTPAIRKFVSVDELVRMKARTQSEVYLLSTRYGVLCDTEAIEKHVGGECLCKLAW
eukprot:TRINITY_DN1154_c0_g1_i2.p1 TRINITY_DN1154_c0_g1~~TRINITY_DN1154_c0_g1_i2.p1  ORF type:complete len:151 (-),score=31.47 TRINITY_DN1154_c0_g1_i2:75-527(-)